VLKVGVLRILPEDGLGELLAREFEFLGSELELFNEPQLLDLKHLACLTQLEHAVRNIGVDGISHTRSIEHRIITVN
jgi:hypothetical protein